MKSNNPLDWISKDGSSQHLDKVPSSEGFVYSKGSGELTIKAIPKVPDNYKTVWQGCIEFNLSRTGSNSPIDLDIATSITGLTDLLINSKHSLIGVSIDRATGPYIFLENHMTGDFEIGRDFVWLKTVSYPLGGGEMDVYSLEANLVSNAYTSAPRRKFYITRGYMYNFKAVSETFEGYFQVEKAYLRNITIIRD